MQPGTEIEFSCGGSADAKAQSEELARLYEADFVDPPLQGTHFYSKQRFLKMLFEDYTPAPHFRLITARAGNQLVGFIYGCSLPRGTKWWRDVKEPLPPGFDDEDGKRTLALLDVLVKKNYRGQGIGRRLHDKLLEISTEERITLMSSPPQQPAYAIWLHWGYEKIGTAAPAGDGVVLDVFIRGRHK